MIDPVSANNRPFRLCIMGAGPGDPDLLTLRAANRLKEAAVVLYDHLANKALLDLTSPGCEHIYVGKVAYGAYTPQEVIHSLILEHSKKGLVVRLKGGDPFVFGRGFEEVIFARSHGMVTEYIPGISSMQTFGFEDIPLTHRGVSEGIWVITGTKKDTELSDDLHLAMKSKATVVVYMGLKKLELISSIYRLAGNHDMPAAILQQAASRNSRCIRGRIGSMPELAALHSIKYPAIILIGKVAALSDLTENQEA